MEKLKENQIFSLCSRAKKLASYEPSEEVNAFFSELCEFASGQIDYELDFDPIFVSVYLFACLSESGDSSA